MNLPSHILVDTNILIYAINGDSPKHLAATAITNGIYKIATDNTKDFKKFMEIKIINPFI